MPRKVPGQYPQEVSILRAMPRQLTGNRNGYKLPSHLLEDMGRSFAVILFLCASHRQADINANPASRSSQGRATACPVIFRPICLVEKAEINKITIK